MRKTRTHMMSESSKCSHAGGATSQKRRRSRFKRIGGRGKHSYLWFDSLLSQLQIKAVQDFAASKEVQGQTFAAGTSDGDERDRVSRIALLGRPSSQPPPEIPAWLDRKLRQACRQVHTTMGNDICPLGMDSRGLWTPRFEPVQYAEYRTGGHYAAWHTDADADESDLMDLRCVTVVLMLSDAEAYEGGHLEVCLGAAGKATAVSLRAGDAVGFASKHLVHRVSPCTSGLRQTMVFWARRPGTI